MAAVIVRGGNIISVGFNRKETHPQALYGESIHAEADAIKKCNGSLQQAKMFVYRFRGSDEAPVVGSSKPCPRCQRKIKEAGISRVVYVDTDGTLCKENFRNVPKIPRPEMMHLAFGGIAGIY